MSRFQFMTSVLFFLAAASFSALNVPLDVNNWADIARAGEPISAGVPLPSGAIYDLSKLRVTDGSGTTVPCQFRALSRWWWEKNKNGVANPSVKWVLCDFQPASVPARNKTSFFLKDDNSGSAPSTPLTVSDNASGITVVTGPLKFTLSKTVGNFFDGIWLDANNNSQFDAGEQIVTSSSQNGGFITAGDWTAQGCVAGTIHSTLQRAPERVVIDEQGPMKVVVRVEGKHYAAAGGVTKGLYGYKIFYTAYAGKPFVDVQYSITNYYTEFRGAATLDVPGYTVYAWPFKKYEVVLNLNLGATQTYRLLGTTEVTGTASSTPAILHQGRSTYTITGNTGGAMALGAGSVSDGSIGVLAAVRDFGPNCPKDLSIAQNKLSFGIFPDTTGNYALDPQTQETERIRLSFVQGSVAAGAITDLYKQVDAPLRMLASTAWYRDTKAWDRGFGIPPIGWDRVSTSAWTRLTKTARGFKTYGYIGEFNGGGDHWNLTSCFWKYMLTGNPVDFEDAESKAFYFNDIVQVHGGPNAFQNFSFYTEPESHLQAFSEAPHPDVFSQLAITLSFPGYIRNCSDNTPDDGHKPNMQELEYYLLTGDPGTQDVIKEFGVVATMSIWYRTYGLYCGWPYSEHQGALVDIDKFLVMPYGPRYVARPVLVASHAYEITGDDRYLRPLSIFTYSLRNYARQSPIGYIAYANDNLYSGGAPAIWTANHPGVAAPSYFSGSDFQIGIASEALYNYWRVTGDESVRDAAIIAGKSFEWRAAMVNGKYTGFTYSGWADYLCDGKRYSDVGLAGSFGSSASEGFGGLIFGFLASGRSELWNVISDGLTGQYLGGANGFDVGCYSPGGNCFEMKLVNMWEAKYWHDAEDAVPPAPVTNLTALAVPGYVQLSWTAPGDNGNTGTSAEYQVKYARAPIVDFVKRWNATTQTGWPDLRTPLPMDGPGLVAKAIGYQATQEISFWNALNVKGEPAPKAAGNTETFSISGLPKDSLYYFALVSYDARGNVSGISNVVTATSLGVEEGADSTGKALALFGNQPNPCNPSTEIRYYVPFAKSGNISLVLYDLGGKRVNTLFSGKSRVGMQRIQWDGRDSRKVQVASGVYLLRLTCGKVVKERKLVLMK